MLDRASKSLFKVEQVWKKSKTILSMFCFGGLYLGQSEGGKTRRGLRDGVKVAVLRRFAPKSGVLQERYSLAPNKYPVVNPLLRNQSLMADFLSETTLSTSLSGGEFQILKSTRRSAIFLRRFH